MSESKAGFSHGAIPRNALMQPRSVGGSSAVPRLRCPSSAAQGTENQSLIANRPAQVPVWNSSQVTLALTRVFLCTGLTGTLLNGRQDIMVSIVAVMTAARC